MKKSRLSTLLLILFIFSLSFSFSVLRSEDHLLERKNEILSQQITGSESSSDWIPIENILDFKGIVDIQNFDNPNKTIAYNTLNNTEMIFQEIYNHKREFETQIEEFRGLLDTRTIDQESPKSSFVFPPDDRQRVTSTSSFPWRTICKLYITAQNGSRYIGSGAIIDNFHVLTCGHCVYLHDAGGWADEIEIIPGKNNYDEPYGSAYATYYRSYTEWTQSKMVEHDWALLTLDRSLGLFTGWMGRQTADPSSSIYTDILNTAGYPGDLDYGENLYFVSDNGDRADEYNHWFWMDSAGGQSGSPVWTYDGSNRYILSILAYEYINGADANFGTRLNSDKYNQINTWLSDDASTPPNDKAELLEGDFYSSFNTYEVVSGQTNFEIFCDVKNTGTATASSFRVSFYASEDLTISPEDNLIGTKEIYNLQPFDSSSADWSGIFPSETPEGYYYIGYIIDSENSIEEINEINNNVIIGYSRITVRNPLMPFNPIPIIIGVLAFVGIISVIGLIVRTTIKKIPNLDYKDFYYGEFEERKVIDFKEKEIKPKSFKIPDFCTNCGNKIVEGSLFCHNCGNDLRNNIR